MTLACNVGWFVAISIFGEGTHLGLILPGSGQ